MALKIFKNKGESGAIPANADNLNYNFKEVHPVNSYFYTSNENFNPNTELGGTWMLEKKYYGGELISLASVCNNSSNSNAIPENGTIAFSDSYIPEKAYDIKTFDDIVSFDSGTFLIKTKGIVGFVEAYIYISFFNDTEKYGNIWWQNNLNTLPANIKMSSGLQMSTATAPGNYGGASNTYTYILDDNISQDAEFYVNPGIKAYNTSLKPAAYGVKCSLIVKVYSKMGKHYVWKRTA